MTTRESPAQVDGSKLRGPKPGPRTRNLDGISTAFPFDLVVNLEAPLDFGDTHAGRRILHRARSESFNDGRLHWDVVAGGGDWATFRCGGRMSLDVRLRRIDGIRRRC